MKHINTITSQEAPARAVLGGLFGDFDFRSLFGFWVDEVQNSLATWKNSGWDDSWDVGDV